MKKFIFPGSFDPFTNGHKAIVDQTYKLCDEFIIALATNLKKGEGLIKRSERVKLIKEIFKDYPNVTVIDMTDTLISDYCKKNNVSYIVRGIRNSEDFTYEKSLAATNHYLAGVQISDFDISNSKFVKKCVDISFSIDDIVLYETRLYKITDINYITGICSLHEVYANKEISRVGYHRLKPVTFYYFINSSGQTSSSYIGKDPAADSWRALTNNLFYTKDEAVKYRDSILKKKI